MLGMGLTVSKSVLLASQVSLTVEGMARIELM